VDALRLAFSLPEPAHWRELATHPSLALLLDVDGTLVGFASMPEEAVLDEDTVRAIRHVIDIGVHVAIVSGRPRSALEPLVERLQRKIWWYAEHGAWHHDGTSWIGPEATGGELDDLTATLSACSSVPGARIERKTLSVCLHWRSVDADDRSSMIAAAELACDEWMEAHLDYERLPGIDSLEVRRRSVSKGIAVRGMRERLPDARMIAVGDDHTDEDMFAELDDRDMGITVGHHNRPSQAQAALANPIDVRTFLHWIVDCRAGATMVAPPIMPLVEIRARREYSLLVISNRTPAKNVGRQREVGGLVSALEPAIRERGGLWLGWSGQEREGKNPLSIDATTMPPLATFNLTRAWRDKFYAGFCNRVLWPLFHSFMMRVTYNDDDWAAYVAANDAYAQHAVELAKPDGTIWVHDYHLLLVARALRKRGHRGPIGLFLHIPFPPLELLEAMPWHRELLEAMLEFDLIGFHTERWASNFRQAVQGLAIQRIDATTVHRSGHATQIGVFPIPIETSPFTRRSAESADVAGLRDALGARRLLLGVDRLDYSKGIPERLAGFERLLERYPEWRGHVSYVQVSVPSRAEIPDYVELRNRVEMLVGRINGRFGEADWVPVRYLYRSYDQAVLAQLYRLAEVALVTPLRDGMNLVAKEFLASQDEDRPGVLVLSRFAGASEELVDAVLSNPFHPDGLASDIDRALRMPMPERQLRHTRLMRTIRSTDPVGWSKSFLDALASCAVVDRGRGRCAPVSGSLLSDREQIS